MDHPTKLIVALLLVAGCSHSSDAALAIEIPTDAPAGLQQTASDAADLAGKLLGTSVTVAAPGSAAKQRISVLVGDPSCAAAGKGAEAYEIRPTGDAIVVCSDGQLGAEFGLYALLEQNGIRYFHPEETFIPPAKEKLDATAVVASPVFPHRGFHPHTLHPIPMLAALHFPGTVNQKLVDDYLRWLVRNRQDYLQWALIKVPDMNGAMEEARYALDHGHALGIQVGINVLLWGGGISDLQNDYYLLQATATDWKSQIDSSLDWLLQVPWDRLDLSLGEFEQSSDTGLVDWVNETNRYTASKSPNTQVMWSSHVGNVGNSPNYGVYYYFVPQFCDASVGLFVHSVMMYDLNGPAPTYNQTDFHLQRDFLLDQVDKRATWFYPEDSYWLSTDSPIPVLMSSYLVGRSNDIAYLAQNAVPEGLQGQVTFSTADEWDYWLTDYMVAHMTYDGPEPLDSFMARNFAPLGPGGEALGHAVAQEAQTQWSDVVGAALLPYLSGEDSLDDLGYKNGIWNHLPRVPFSTVLAMDSNALDVFESATVSGIDAMAAHERAALATVQALSGQFPAEADGWRAELADGYEVTALRAEHSAALYRAAIAAARSKLDGTDRSAEIAADESNAKDLTAQAAQVVARREPHYRYGTDEIANGPNPTQYPYASLYRAHTLFYWTNQEDDLASALAK